MAITVQAPDEKLQAYRPANAFATGLKLGDFLHDVARRRETEAREDFVWDFKKKFQLSDWAGEIAQKTKQLAYDDAKLGFEADKASYDIFKSAVKGGFLDPAYADGSDWYQDAKPRAGGTVTPTVSGSALDKRRKAEEVLLGAPAPRTKSPWQQEQDRKIAGYDDRADYDRRFQGNDDLPSVAVLPGEDQPNDLLGAR